MQCASVVFLRSNPIAPDPRVEKEARALHQAGYPVTIVGWDRAASLPLIEEREYARIERIALPATFGTGVRNLPYLLRWQLRLCFWLWRNRRRYQIVHACDFDTVLPALMISRLYGKKVVYDVFDFYADMLRKTPSFLRRVVRRIDLWAMGRVDALILVDEARKEQIRGARPRRVEVIYNSPEPCPPPPVRSTHGELRIAYVGLLQVERGLLEMLEVLERHPEWDLDLAGFGGDAEVILAVARKLPNVRVYGRVPYEEAIRLYAQADVLFATYDPAIPNHRYASANKLFEGMMLGKPVIVARGTGMDRLVERYKVGFVVDYGDVNQLESVLYKIACWRLREKEAFAKRARAVYTENFSWDRMATRLVNLYAKLIQGE
ncbi:MAG: glycosyltransferase family 4 protein [Anaerolineae bacterium]